MLKSILMLTLLSGCTTTTAAMVIDGNCTINERAELSGMRTGAAIVTPDAAAMDRMSALEAECK